MSRVKAKLNAMGLALPPARKYPSPKRCGCVRVGTILFVSGHPPQHPDTKIREPGRLGADMTIEEGYTAARIAALLMLATIKGEVVVSTRLSASYGCSAWLTAAGLCRSSAALTVSNTSSAFAIVTLPTRWIPRAIAPPSCYSCRSLLRLDAQFSAKRSPLVLFPVNGLRGAFRRTAAVGREANG
jgi:hypothetical protein